MEKRIARIRIISTTIEHLLKNHESLTFGSHHPVISTPIYYSGRQENSLTNVWILEPITGLPIYLPEGTFEGLEYREKPSPSLYGFVSAFQYEIFKSYWAIEGGRNEYFNRLRAYEALK